LDIKVLPVIKYGSTDLFCIPGVLEKPGGCFEVTSGMTCVREASKAKTKTKTTQDKDKARQDGTRQEETNLHKDDARMTNSAITFCHIFLVGLFGFMIGMCGKWAAPLRSQMREGTQVKARREHPGRSTFE
jgi:hypothetical protein